MSSAVRSAHRSPGVPFKTHAVFKRHLNFQLFRLFSSRQRRCCHNQSRHAQPLRVFSLPARARPSSAGHHMDRHLALPSDGSLVVLDAGEDNATDGGGGVRPEARMTSRLDSDIGGAGIAVPDCEEVVAWVMRIMELSSRLHGPAGARRAHRPGLFLAWSMLQMGRILMRILQDAL